MKKLFCSVMIMMLCAGCTADEAVDNVVIFVDSSAAECITEAVETYKEENAVNTEIVKGSTRSLFNRIEEGEECDIFIPSSKEQINALIDDKLLDRGNVTTILENNVVVIKKLGEDSGVKSFDTVSEASNMAMANESEPVGAYAREIFINMGIFEDVLKMKTTDYEDSPAVVNAVIEGECEIGICFETDALAQADKVQIIASQPKDSLNSEAVYSVALLKGEDGEEPDDNTKALSEYLDSPEAADIFESYDFEIYID